MALGDASSPARFGAGQTNPATDDRVLFLKIFGGEVLAAFTENVVTLDKHVRQQIASGKSAQFPKTWKASSEYHTAGAELLGTDIDTDEVEITVDGLLVSHVGIYDLDQKMSHFDVSGEFSAELGRQLARSYDTNVFRSIILAARTAATSGWNNAGQTIVDATLTNTGVTNGEAWINHIREANRGLFSRNVPEDTPRFMACNANVFEAIKYATDTNGNYIVINRDLNGVVPGGMAGGVSGRQEVLLVDGVQIFRSNLMPTTNETADTSVWVDYRADYSATTAVMWCPQSVGTVELIGVNMETERDVRRQEDFMVAKMAVGHGTLRQECAVEFKTV